METLGALSFLRRNPWDISRCTPIPAMYKDTILQQLKHGNIFILEGKEWRTSHKDDVDYDVYVDYTRDPKLVRVRISNDDRRLLIRDFSKLSTKGVYGDQVPNEAHPV